MSAVFSTGTLSYTVPDDSRRMQSPSTGPSVLERLLIWKLLLIIAP